MRSETLSDFELGYIAGFLDGEGHITIMRSYPGRARYKMGFHSIQVVMANNKVKVLEWIQMRIGGAIYSQEASESRGNRKTCYRLVLSGQKSKQFLLTIAPYVLLKGEQVALALEYLELGKGTNPIARAAMCDRMRALNKRGVDWQQNGQQPDVSHKTPSTQEGSLREILNDNI